MKDVSFFQATETLKHIGYNLICTIKNPNVLKRLKNHKQTGFKDINQKIERNKNND